MPTVSGPKFRSAGRRPFHIFRNFGPSAREFRPVDELASPAASHILYQPDMLLGWLLMDCESCTPCRTGCFLTSGAQHATYFTQLACCQLACYPTVTLLQDWVFFDRGSLELTMELHEQMKPPLQQLPAMWQLNKPALLRFSEMVSSWCVNKICSVARHPRCDACITTATATCTLAVSITYTSMWLASTACLLNCGCTDGVSHRRAKWGCMLAYWTQKTSLPCKARFTCIRHSTTDHCTLQMQAGSSTCYWHLTTCTA
jgi:hypothetical protein